MLHYLEVEKDDIFPAIQNILNNLQIENDHLPVIISVDQECKNSLITLLEVYDFQYQTIDNFYLTDNHHINLLIKKSISFYENNFAIGGLIDLIEASGLEINKNLKELIYIILPRLKIDLQKNFAALLTIEIKNQDIIQDLTQLNIICSELNSVITSSIKENFQDFLIKNIKIIENIMKIISGNDQLEPIIYSLENCSINLNYEISGSTYIKIIDNQIDYIGSKITEQLIKLLIMDGLNPEFIVSHRISQINIIYITNNIQIIEAIETIMMPLYKQKIFLLLYYYNHSSNSLLQNLSQNHHSEYYQNCLNSQNFQNEIHYNLKSSSHHLIEKKINLFSNYILETINAIPKHKSEENFSKKLLKLIIAENDIIPITSFSLYRLTNNINDFTIIDLLGAKKNRSIITNKFSNREAGYLVGKIIKLYLEDEQQDIFIITTKCIKQIASEKLYLYIENKLQIILNHFLQWMEIMKDEYKNKGNIHYNQEITSKIQCGAILVEIKNFVPIIIYLEDKIILYDFIFNNYAKSALENLKQPAMISAAIYFLESDSDREVIIRYVNLKDVDLKEIEIKKTREAVLKLKTAIEKFFTGSLVEEEFSH